jgi:hypothetical protein
MAATANVPAAENANRACCDQVSPTDVGCAVNSVEDSGEPVRELVS